MIEGEKQPNPKDNAQEPFIIRAHHAISSKYLFNGLVSAEEMTAGGTLGAKLAADLGNGTEYVKDVLGTTEEEEQSWKDGTYAFYKHQADLAPEDSVKIVSGKDGICNSCAIGEHCKVPSENTDDGKDVKYIKRFAEAVEKKDLDANLIYEEGLPTLTTSKKTLITLVEDYYNGTLPEIPPK